ncbi:hypothetical protein ACIA8G_06700 [Lentzea sp. NPDC051213]|uniref:hypothetical protein n=1 Tax=Lentzea sp. NPDC051213 TaxID=3364126 RepID=UPI0037B5AD36
MKEAAVRFMVFLRSPKALAAQHSDVLLRGGVLLDAGDLCVNVCGVSGYWLIDVRNHEEAVERVRRIPLSACVVEIRQVAVV